VLWFLTIRCSYWFNCIMIWMSSRIASRTLLIWTITIKFEEHPIDCQVDEEVLIYQDFNHLSKLAPCTMEPFQISWAHANGTTTIQCNNYFEPINMHRVCPYFHPQPAAVLGGGEWTIMITEPYCSTVSLSIEELWEKFQQSNLFVNQFLVLSLALKWLTFLA